MRAILAAIMGLGLAGCVPVVASGPSAPPAPVAAPLEAPVFGGPQTPQAAAASFVQVVERVEPVAEQICRARARGVNCDLQIVVDDRPNQPPNAFQTIDRSGRPIVGFTLSLIADARNADEIAFVMGHEAAHHIAGHIPKREQTALTSAILAGVIAQAGGGSAEVIEQAQSIGAEIGARSYSKEFELEADALGAEIAVLAGFDPVRGAAFFDRLPDPGDQFLGSHPPNAQRQATVRATVAAMRGL